MQVGANEFKGRLLELNERSVLYTCYACFLRDDHSLCQTKAEWVRKILQQTGLPHLGYLNMDGERCVGGAEFLPAALVPYPIPGLQPNDAYITCSFLTHEDYDYKSYPLRTLLDYLKNGGYGRALIVAAVQFGGFGIASGAFNLGHLAYEETEHADPHLLEMSYKHRSDSASTVDSGQVYLDRNDPIRGRSQSGYFVAIGDRPQIGSF